MLAFRQSYLLALLRFNQGKKVNHEDCEMANASAESKMSQLLTCRSGHLLLTIAAGVADRAKGITARFVQEGACKA